MTALAIAATVILACAVSLAIMRLIVRAEQERLATSEMFGAEIHVTDAHDDLCPVCKMALDDPSRQTWAVIGGKTRLVHLECWRGGDCRVWVWNARLDRKE